MLRTRALASISIALAGAVFFSAATLPAQNSPSATATPSAAATTHRATLDKYCISCHRGPTPLAGLTLETLDTANFETNGATWEKLARKLRNREMPPAGMPRPDAATYDALVRYIETGRDRLAEAKPNPGRPTLHRLNRTEYGNAVRDLLALEIDVAELLPADDIGYGFDNIGDVLQVSPVLLERYLSAARKISRAAVGDTTIPVSYQTYTVPHGLIQTDRLSEDAPVGSRGGTIVRHLFPVDGEYEISLTVQRNRDDEYLGLERERKLDLRLDDQRLQLFTIAANPKKVVLGGGTPPDAHLKIRVPVKAGMRELAATFLKDTLVQEGIIERVRDDVVSTYFEGVGTITVAGPFNVQGPGDTVTRDRIFICRPSAAAEQEACAQKILSNLAHRAYRRPVSDSDTTQLLALYKTGAQNGGFEAGVRLALQKILVSPDFLFRAEHDPAGAKPGSVYKVSDIELASRLSFFLWSSIPDDQLLAVAESGRLSDPTVLQAQVKRMLADPRSQALVENFSGQWLFLRNIARITPDTTTYTYFDENLRHALAKETRAPDRKSGAGGSERRRPVEYGLHLPQSAPGRALWDQGHLRQRVPPRQARRPEPTRTARTGQHPGGDLLSQPDGADHPRKVGVGAALGYAATTSAAECSIVERRWDRAEADHARTHGTAQGQSNLRRVPPHDGSTRLRAGELRRSWRLARLRRARVGTDRCLRGPARRHEVHRPGGLARGPGEETGPVR